MKFILKFISKCSENMGKSGNNSLKAIPFYFPKATLFSHGS